MTQAPDQDQKRRATVNDVVGFAGAVGIVLVFWILYEDSIEREQQQQASRDDDLAISALIERSSADRLVEDYRVELETRTELDVSAAVKVSPHRTGRTFEGIVCTLGDGTMTIRRVDYREGTFLYPEITHADDHLLEQITGICTKALGQNPA